MTDTVGIDEVVDSAVMTTGLTDFGDEYAWRDALTVLLAAVAAEADLNDIGRSILRTWIAERLKNRLRVIDWWRRHPDAHDAPVVAPLIVVGMLRTGSTLLCELLAADPENRPLMKWEGLNSIPPPTTATFTTDVRIAAEVEKQESIYSMVPALKAVHWEPGDGPTECVALLTQAFRAQDWYGLFRVPAYVEWLHHCDMAPAYEYHRLALRVLQSTAPGRWSLKAPGHLIALDALRAVYPDARIVVLHRDPLRTVPSSASLSANSHPESLSHSDVRDHFPRQWFETLATMTDRLMEHRDRCGNGGFFDVQYADLVSDPLGTIANIYAAFDGELSGASAAPMRAHLAEHPQGKHGTHRYTPEELGLSTGAIRERFAAYCERFAVPSEAESS